MVWELRDTCLLSNVFVKHLHAPSPPPVRSYTSTRLARQSYLPFKVNATGGCGGGRGGNRGEEGAAMAGTLLWLAAHVGRWHFGWQYFEHGQGG